jgi:hypothetical protein
MLIGPKKSAELSERISAAALELKRSDEQGLSFIRPWRLNARRETKELISCSECGCGISPDLK